MTPFPHFADLPPVPAAQAAQILSHLKTTPRMVRFNRLAYGLAVVAELYIFALYWLALRTGFAAKLRDFAERIIRRGLFLQAALTYLLFTLCVSIAGLPLSITRGYYIPKHYGLTSESVQQWQMDHWKGIGVGAATGALIAGLLILIIRRAPRRWPLIAAAVMVPIIAFGIFISPILIDPLFNKFMPLSPSRPIWTQIHALAVRAGIGNAAIYVADKSLQSNEINAYVTGFGPSLRIVIWDTTLQKLPARDVVAIVGHEMGHYVEGHLVIGFCLSVLGLFLVIPALRLLALSWLTRYGPRWGLRGSLHDPAAIVLLLLCADVVSLPIAPLSNTVSRWIEHRADAFSLGMVRDRIGLADSFVALSQQDLEDPYPPLWEKIWFDDHPPIGERVRFALYGQPDQ